jgi:histone deacetylase 1/2
MYGLPQAGKLSQTRLIQHLKENGYTQCPNTPCLFRHHTREIMFCLVVDDFGVRYKTQADADHLISTLEKYDYKLKVRPLGDVYLGMAISFNRQNKTVSISMPGYVKKMLQRFRPQYLLPGHRPPRTPGVYIAPSFSKKPQTIFIDKSEKLSPTLVTELQAIIGTLLYYARAVDPTLLPIANELASQQANATRRILNAANRALSYCAAFSNNQIIYHACDMALHVFADASYLCRSHARSVAGAIFFLGNHNDPTRINGSIHVFSSIIPCVVASAGEAEYAALFAAGQHAASIRTTLSDMGYPQNPTIIMCDNTSAIGIATDSIKQKRSKAIDMRFHWIRDRVRQSQFTIAYIPTSQNLADYFTKNLPYESHAQFHPFLVRPSTNASETTASS